MITAECFAGITQIVGCTFTEVFGTTIVGALAGFLIIVYAMHKSGLNMTASIPLAFLAVFSLFWITMDTGTFQIIMLIVMLVGAAILGFALLRYFKR